MRTLKVEDNWTSLWISTKNGIMSQKGLHTRGSIQMNLNPWVGPVTRAVIVLAIIICTYLLISFALPLVYPFLIGWLIAMAIEPMVRWLERRARMPRWAGVTVILFILLVLLSSLLIFIVAEVVVELAKLAEFLPVLFNKVGQMVVGTFTKNQDFQRIIDTVQSYLEKNPEHQQRIASSIQENIGILANKGTEMITDILSGIGSFLSNLPYYITVLVFITLASLFIGLEWPRLRSILISLIPNKIHKTVGFVLDDLKRALFGFIRAQLTLVSITALIMFIGLVILRVPYAFTIAIIVGVVDLLPYLGVGAVVIPWIIYLFLTGNIHLAVGLSIVYGVIIIVRQLLEPKLVASNVGIDPLLTLIALFIGLKLIGFFGLILGPVTVVFLQALHRTHVFKDIWQYIVGKPAE